MMKYFKQIIIFCLLMSFAASCTVTSPPILIPTETIPMQASESVETLAPTEPHPDPTPETVQMEEVVTVPDQDSSSVLEEKSMLITIGDVVLTAALVDNSSVDALLAALSESPTTIDMRDYGAMEKVGLLGMTLPRNDQQITTEAGDIILYQGNAFVIYYAPNSWNFTRLGKIDNVTAEQLKEILGNGDVTITLSLP